MRRLALAAAGQGGGDGLPQQGSQHAHGEQAGDVGVGGQAHEGGAVQRVLVRQQGARQQAVLHESQRRVLPHRHARARQRRPCSRDLGAHAAHVGGLALPLGSEARQGVRELAAQGAPPVHDPLNRARRHAVNGGDGFRQRGGCGGELGGGQHDVGEGVTPEGQVEVRRQRVPRAVHGKGADARFITCG